MDATLIVVEGAKKTQIRLRLPTDIGRSKRAKIKLRASRVSRTHCRLYEQDNSLFVEDLDSSNGTFVNDDRILMPTKLVPDDRLRIGPVTFRVFDISPEIEDAADEQDAAALDSDGEFDESDEDHHSADVSYERSDHGSKLSIDEIADFLRDLEEDVQQSSEAPAEPPSENDVNSDDSALNDFFRKMNE